WVADGLRSLGSSVDRKAFQNLLVEMLKENNIEFVHVKEADYDGRFLRRASHPYAAAFNGR
ncbi:bifunctional DNA-binding transcriptional repressor/ NMN adenylyltransferase, partial [Salmonella enterica subsp. enterica serovar Heidelberg str. 607310-1]